MIPAPVGYYKLNGNANDSVGSNNGTASVASWPTGKIGQCASFTGSHYISLPTAFSLGTVYSIGFWMNPTTTGGEPIGGDVLNDSYAAYLNSSSIQHGALGAANVNLSFGASIPLSSWSYVLITRNNLTVKLYVDSVLTDTKTLPSNIPFSLSQFGRENPIGVPYYYNGLLDEVGI